MRHVEAQVRMLNRQTLQVQVYCLKMSTIFLGVHHNLFIPSLRIVYYAVHLLCSNGGASRELSPLERNRYLRENALFSVTVCTLLFSSIE